MRERRRGGNAAKLATFRKRFGFWFRNSKSGRQCAMRTGFKIYVYARLWQMEFHAYQLINGGGCIFRPGREDMPEASIHDDGDVAGLLAPCL